MESVEAWRASALHHIWNILLTQRPWRPGGSDGAYTRILVELSPQRLMGASPGIRIISSM